jgi:pimeloyl-ACP methyl ester carboxylesterase
VTLVDFYGFGKTPSPNYPLKLQDYVNSILDIIKFYKMHDIILIGHSFGGRVATVIASNYGYLLEKLVLVDSAGLKPRRRMSYYFRLYRHKLLTKLNIKHTSGSVDYRKLDDISKVTFKNIINEELTPLLKKITLPTLIFWGSKDKETPIYMARRLYKNILCSTLIVCVNAGHYSYIEKHNEFYMLLKCYLTEDSYAMDDIICGHNLGGDILVKVPHIKSK